MHNDIAQYIFGAGYKRTTKRIKEKQSKENWERNSRVFK